MRQASLSERLGARGWRMTRQRRAIVSVLEASEGHLSAEEVQAALRGAGPRVSLATVYNTLVTLAAMGELREVRAGRGPARFDTNVAPHDHLVCDQCGRLIDVAPVAVTDVKPVSAREHGFVIDGVDVIVHGRCSRCAGGE
jgi:Fe2+ or Zn2+ uptake regulation protein